MEPTEPGKGARPRLGISACLLGEAVRYDGGHRREPLLAEILAPHVEWVPVCPEVEMGLGVPREPLRLERAGGEVRLVGERSRLDRTDAARGHARARVAALAALGIVGYVAKSRSPSCGPRGLPVHGARGPEARAGRGIFVSALAAAIPWLPVESEERLRDVRFLEPFLERVFALAALARAASPRADPEALRAFHEAHAFELLARAPRAAAALARRLADGAGGSDADRCRTEFVHGVRAILARPPSHGRRRELLERAAAALGPTLDAAEREALRAALAPFRRGLAPASAVRARLAAAATAAGLADPPPAARPLPYPFDVVARVGGEGAGGHGGER